LLRGPGQEVGEKVPASSGYHLTGFASFGTWFLFPMRGGSDSACTNFQGLSNTDMPVCAIVSQPSHHPTRALNNGQEMQEIEPSKDKNG